MRTYAGVITQDGVRQVEVVTADGRRHPLALQSRLFPEPLSDFDWGSWSRGTQKLAYALLTDAVGEGWAVSLHLLYALDVVARLERDRPWRLAALEVDAWVNRPVPP